MNIYELFPDKNLNELGNELLGRYKKAAGADATAADQRGDFEHGHKRFKGIVKATNKQFANDLKKHKKPEDSLNEFAPGQGGDSGNYFHALASAWYNGTFNSKSLQKGIKSQEDVERLLQRGIICPDGVKRKFGIDYNADFDGVVISSDDYYEHADHDNTDSRTGKPFGPYDYMEFSDDELDESVQPGVAEGLTRQFDMIEEWVESIAAEHGVDAEQIWEDFDAVDDATLLETAAWHRKAGKNKNGGLNRKGVMSYRREHPGSKLQTAVTTKPSKLKPGSKAAKRRKSFCARMSGVKGPTKKPNGKPTRKALALRKWNCHESVMEAANAAQQAAIAIAKKKQAGVDEAGIMGFMSPKPVPQKPSTPLSVMRKEFEKDKPAPMGQVIYDKDADEKTAQVHRRPADEGKIIHPEMINLYVQLRKHGSKPMKINSKPIPYKVMDALIDKLSQKYSNVRPDMFSFVSADKDGVSEEAGGTGVVASKSQARDPRYSMSLTRDVRPGQIEKNLKAFKLAEKNKTEDANGQIGISNNDSTSPIHGFEESLDDIIESRLYSMKRAGYDIL